MRTLYDLSKSNAVIDEYLSLIRNPTTMNIGRTAIEFIMQRQGMIPDVRKMAFGESHALWYAALITTKRIKEVSKAEIDNHRAQKGRTLELAVRAVKKDKTGLFGVLLREILRNDTAGAKIQNKTGLTMREHRSFYARMSPILYSDKSQSVPR